MHQIFYVFSKFKKKVSGYELVTIFDSKVFLEDFVLR